MTTENPHELPTVSSTLASRYVAVLVCRASSTPAAAMCRWSELRWRWANCQSRLTDFVCTGGPPSE